MALGIAKSNVERFKNGADVTSKIITKINNKHISNFTKKIKENDEQIKQLLSDLKDQKVDMAIRYDPWKDRMYYKQSDDQKNKATITKMIGTKYDDLNSKEKAIVSKYDKKINSAKTKDQAELLELELLEELDKLNGLL